MIFIFFVQLISNYNPNNSKENYTDYRNIDLLKTNR